MKSKIGIGAPNSMLNVYIGNRPNFAFLNQSQAIGYLVANEIHACGQACGNGWRKVFNVYAKLVYATALKELIAPTQYVAMQSTSMQKPINSWQEYRDTLLLREHSNTALIFSPLVLNDSNCLHIVMGKTYANTLNLPKDIRWINHEFAISKAHNLIVCPYFDYRQLSNIKILFLVDLIQQLLSQK